MPPIVTSNGESLSTPYKKPMPSRWRKIIWQGKRQSGASGSSRTSFATIDENDELEQKIREMMKNEKEREDAIRDDCHWQMDQQQRAFLGERATKEQEYLEKALEFEKQVRSGGATSLRASPIQDLNSPPPQMPKPFHPVTPPSKGRDRRELLSPIEHESECEKTDPPVQEASRSRTRTKAPPARISRHRDSEPGSDPGKRDPPGPPRGPPSSQGGLGFDFYEQRFTARSWASSSSSSAS